MKMWLFWWRSPLIRTVTVRFWVLQKASREKAAAVIAELKAMKLPEAAKKVADGIEETLTYCDFPAEHWNKIRTNNVIERVNREIRN